jgi:alpha-beta hydrolase superfamily lysophospholipase
LGDSPGDQVTLQFSDWFEDCQTAIEIAKAEEPESGIVLFGSSMGAWISLKMVLENEDLIKGLVLVAPAVNFMWSFYLVQ